MQNFYGNLTAMKGPVFIFGTVRTGSSQMTQALGHIGYKGHSEGHLLPIFHLIDETIDNFYAANAYFRIPGTMFSDVSADRLREMNHQNARALVAQFYQTDSWVEKTVNRKSLNSIATYFKIWPSAAGIFTIRRPLEIFRSRQIKFPENKIHHMIGETKNIFNHWLRIREQYPQVLQIDQYETATQPRNVARKLRQHLDLNDEAENKLTQIFQSNFPERTSANYDPITLDDLNLSPDDRTLVTQELSEVFAAFGYSWDKKYYL